MPTVLQFKKTKTSSDWAVPFDWRHYGTPFTKAHCNDHVPRSLYRASALDCFCAHYFFSCTTLVTTLIDYIINSTDTIRSPLPAQNFHDTEKKRCEFHKLEHSFTVTSTNHHAYSQRREKEDSPIPLSRYVIRGQILSFASDVGQPVHRQPYHLAKCHPNHVGPK